MLLEGLAVGLAPNGVTDGAGSAPGSPRKQPPGSPTKRRQDRLAAAQEQQQRQRPFLKVERLLLQHQHDGTFCLHRLHIQATRGGGPLTSAPVAADPEAASSCSLQRVSIELGAVALSVSKPLLTWVQREQQRAAAAQVQRRAAEQRVALGADQPQPGGAQRQQRLQAVLGLLPRECELTAASCGIASDSGSAGVGALSGTGGSSDEAELPLAAAFELHGVRLRLGKGLPSGPDGNHAGSSAEADGLFTIAAGWHRLAVSLGAAGAVAPSTAANGSRLPLPPALAMSSGTAEWSLDILQPSAGASGCGSGSGSSNSGSGTRQAPGQLSAVGQVSIGALHTDVCYPAVQPLVARLREVAAAVKHAVKPPSAAAAESADGAAKALVPVSRSGVPALEVPAERLQGVGGPKRPAPPLLAAWQATVRLGDGSRLLFSDAAGRCCWSNGLASCRLAVRGGSAGSGFGSRDGGSDSADAQAEAAAGSISGSFEVEGIEMYAAATALSSMPVGAQAPEASAAVGGSGQVHAPLPPQMLSAQLLRVDVEHAVQPTMQQAAREQKAEQAVGVAQQQPSRGTSVDATTSGVHLLVQQQQLATVASVIVSLLPPPREADHPTTPEETAAAADSLLQAASRAAVSAAAAAVAPPARRRRRLQLSFACADTVLLLPTTVTAPAAHCPTGRMLLLPAAPALLLSSVSGRLGDAVGASQVQAEGCSLLYCEGAGSQRFPSSSDALKGEGDRVSLGAAAAFPLLD